METSKRFPSIQRLSPFYGPFISPTQDAKPKKMRNAIKWQRANETLNKRQGH